MAGQDIRWQQRFQQFQKAHSQLAEAACFLSLRRSCYDQSQGMGNTMRLTEEQVSIIVHLARTILGEQVQVSVYGSRLDDFLRGGDLDLLLESPERIPVLVRAEFKMTLEQALQVAVDILVYQTGQAPSPFQAIALSHSRALGCTA